MATFDLQAAKQAGATDQQIQAYLQKRPDLTVSGANVPAAPAQQPQGGGLADWLPTLGSIAGGAFGTAAGPLGTIGGSALGGGAGEFLRQLIAGQSPNVASIGKEAALGGAGGLVGNVAGGVFKGARALLTGGKAAAQAGTEAAPNVVERLGQTLRKGVIQPKVPASATAYGEEAQLLQKAKEMGLYGPAEQQRAQSDILYNKLKGDIQNKLAVNNPPLDPNLTKAAVQDSIKGTLNYDAKSPIWKRALDVRTKQVLDTKNLQQLFQYKRDLGDRLGRTFRKIEAGTDLTTQEEAGLATWQALDRIITQTAPELKDATLQMSALHKLAPGLKTSATKGVKVPIVGNVPGVTPVVQTAQDAAGRALEAVGGSNIPGVVSNVAGKTASQLTARAGFNPPQEQPTGPTSDFGITATPTNTSPLADFGGGNAEKTKQAFTLMMMKNPKQAATLKAIYDFGFAPTGAGGNVGKVTAKDYSIAKSGLDNLQTLKQLFKEDPNALVKQLVPGKFFSRKLDSTLFDVADALLRLRTGAQANSSEVKAYMKTIGPSFGDNPSDIQFKLNKLEQDLRQYTQGGSASVSDFNQPATQ